MVSIKVYVEGGGDSRSTRSDCRRGFAEFFAKILPRGQQPSVVACGSRNAAYADFQTALSKNLDAFVILLVDSEGPVAPDDSPWFHLQKRDKWDRPVAASDEHVHLMVQVMEAWFLADRQALAGFFGQGFVATALPARHDIEQIDKHDVLGGLAAATKHTKTKGEYHKTKHAFELLALISPTAVRGASSHAERLCSLLERKASR